MPSYYRIFSVCVFWNVTYAPYWIILVYNKCFVNEGTLCVFV